MSRLFTLKEAASFLSVSYRTIRRYLKNGLPYTEVKGDKGIEYRLAEQELTEFKKARIERPRQGAKLRDIYICTAKDAVDGSQEIYVRTERTKKGISEDSGGLDKKLIEMLESENAFLRQQISSKDKQLADYHTIVKRLSHQNEVLTMISQGVEPKLLLKGGGTAQDNAVYPDEPEDEGYIIQEEKTQLSKAEIIAEAKRLHKAGKSAEEIRQFVACYGYNSFSDLLQKP